MMGFMEEEYILPANDKSVENSEHEKGSVQLPCTGKFLYCTENQS